MPQATVHKADAAVAATPEPYMWVLMQTEPTFELLAASSNRDRLRSELAELHGCNSDGGRRKKTRFVIRQTNLLFA